MKLIGQWDKITDAHLHYLKKTFGSFLLHTIIPSIPGSNPSCVQKVSLLYDRGILFSDLRNPKNWWKKPHWRGGGINWAYLIKEIQTFFVLYWTGNASFLLVFYRPYLCPCLSYVCSVLTLYNYYYCYEHNFKRNIFLEHWNLYKLNTIFLKNRKFVAFLKNCIFFF